MIFQQHFQTPDRLLNALLTLRVGQSAPWYSIKLFLSENLYQMLFYSACLKMETDLIASVSLIEQSFCFI